MPPTLDALLGDDHPRITRFLAACQDLDWTEWRSIHGILHTARDNLLSRVRLDRCNTNRCLGENVVALPFGLGWAFTGLFPFGWAFTGLFAFLPAFTGHLGMGRLRLVDAVTFGLP